MGDRKMKFKVVFKIEGERLSDGYCLNKKNLGEMILMAFDCENGSPLFDETLDTRVKDVEIEDLSELRIGLQLEDSDAS